MYILKCIDNDIEKVLHVFDDYLTEEPNLDIQLTKYGYLAIMQTNKKENIYQINQKTQHTFLTLYLILWLKIIYMKNKQKGPRELFPEFYKRIQKYIEQLPEYEVLLNAYIGKDE